MSFLSRFERLGLVESTQDVVRGWLADGLPEVAFAVADQQSGGRGRAGRSWVAPPGAALLCSLGFRPAWLEPTAAWQLGAVTALAMADAAEDEAGLPVGTIRCKWPNDLVVEAGTAFAAPAAEPVTVRGGDPSIDEDPIDRDPARREAPASPMTSPTGVRKLAGVLGDSDGLGTDRPVVAVGIGINADWAARDFPAELATTMTSLREAAHGRPIDRDALLDGFLARIEARVEALRRGRFPVDDWSTRQITTGRTVRIEGVAGEARDVLALGVDPRTGALLVADPSASGGEHPVYAGEVTRVRVVEPPLAASV